MSWQGCELQFLPERALWLEQEGLLLIADVHLGKAEHLQRHGIPLPSDGDAANLERIESVIKEGKGGGKAAAKDKGKS